MKKQLTFLAAASALALGAYAAPITPEAALARVNAGAPVKARAASDMRLARTVKTADGVSSAYLFVPADGRGFTILSADDLAVPVLGYSAEGTIDPANLPPAMIWWLNETARRAEYAAAHGAEGYAAAPAPADMEAIAPLLTTKWNQDAPYNDDAPVLGGIKAPTGCVATSFAQVMNYFKYPEKGKGSISYIDSGGTRRTLNLSRKAFDWDNMLDVYTAGNYTDDQAAAVAYLMKACGYSVEMGYGISASGAQSYKLANAAINYFNYDKGTYYTERDLYSADQWTRLVYDNIKNVGPVIYDGSALEGGHSFVCDGYDGNGYFHFNWGWGGISDGYYALDSLNPSSQGIGGAEGGFNYSQGILLGMCPDKGDASSARPDMMKVNGTVTGTLSGDILKFKATGSRYAGWGNCSWRNITVNVGVVITKADASGTHVADVQGGMASGDSFSAESTTVSIGPTMYYNTASINPVVTIPAGLADGEYIVTLASRTADDDSAPWVPMATDWGKNNFCYLTVNGGALTVHDAAVAELKFDECEINTPLYVGSNARIVSKVVNSSDKQLTLCYSPMLYRDGAPQYQGDYMLVTVDPGTTIEKEAFVSFLAVDGATSTGAGTYTLKVINRFTGEIIGTYGDYEMDYTTGALKVELETFEVPGVEQKDVKVGTRTFKNTYIITGDEAKVDFAYKVMTGYLDGIVEVNVSRYDAETKTLNPWESPVYNDNPFAGEGQVVSDELTIDFTGHDHNTVYSVRASYILHGSRKNIGNNIYIGFGNSGVDGVIADTDETAEYFSLQGVRLDTPEKGQPVIRKSGSKTEKVIY